MISIFSESPLLLLFVVAVGGHALGRLSLGGVRLGTAGLLFAGLAAGAVDPALRLPELVYQLGLVLFVYTIGLASGPGFFAGLRGRGAPAVQLALAVVALAAALVVAIGRGLGWSGATRAGVFAGALTNTPALAGAIDFLRAQGRADAELALPVVGYSIAYPFSVLAALLVAKLAGRWLAGEAAAPPAAADALTTLTVRVTHEAAVGRTLAALRARHEWDANFGRIKRGAGAWPATDEHRLDAGDLVTVIGTPSEVARVAAALGEPSAVRIELDRSRVDYRRLFVSNPRLAGQRLRDLDLPQHLGVVVTRLRRGDVELLPSGDTVLELGDRIRVVARREHMDAVTRFFGDSYRSLAEFDVPTFSLGLALGLLLGLVPLPLPGHLTVRLGMAGGPLVVALLLGALHRTGPLVWTIPYGANMTLRQLGAILFLCGIGTRAGSACRAALVSPGGFSLAVAGFLTAGFASVLVLVVGHVVLRLPRGVLLGVLAGALTQPAVLAFALEETGDDQPNLGYALVLPVAMFAKIVAAQLLVALS